MFRKLEEVIRHFLVMQTIEKIETYLEKRRVVEVDIYPVFGDVLKGVNAVGFYSDRFCFFNGVDDVRHGYAISSIRKIVIRSVKTIDDIDQRISVLRQMVRIVKNSKEDVNWLIFHKSDRHGVVRPYYITNASRFYALDGYDSDYPWITLASTYGPDNEECVNTIFFGLYPMCNFDRLSEALLESPTPS
jgi:hypothetical protein